jgi:Uma2 family endonuclease
MPNLTLKDVEQLQATLDQAGLAYQLELTEGKITVMGPSDIVASEVGSRLIAFLFAWVSPRRLGRIFDSSGGFLMPGSEDLKAPDVSFVRASRLKRSVRYFGNLVPDLVVEIKSQSDRVPLLKQKLQAYLAQGAQVGLLVDPDRETVTLLRSTGPSITLKNGALLTIPELFPGWELPVTELWPPVYEDES